MSKSPFEIDKHRLDEECEKQPLLMHEMAMLQADEEDAVATAKANFELVEAEVELLVRNDPSKFVKNPTTKITETLITSLVKVSKRYQEALRAYNAAKHAADVAKAGVSATEHKKRMIEKLVELQGRDYFAAPRMNSTVGSTSLPVERKKKRRPHHDED